MILANINSSINDNSCDPNSASIFTVPLAEVDSFVLSNPYSYLWTSNNSSLTINNAASTLNPLIDPAPTQDTWFYLTVTDSLNCVAVDSVFFSLSVNGCTSNFWNSFKLLLK